MKIKISLFFLLLFYFGNAQNSLKQAYQDCKTKECRIKNAFLNAEFYLEEDNIIASQEWLNIAKTWNTSKKIDTTRVFIHSLQSELFYYSGLYQFGSNEADKTIANSKQLKDSLLVSNGYFFKGLNLFELNKLAEAQKMFWKSRDFQPKKTVKKHIRSAILNEHIYNNIAQIKQKLKDSDSAIWYNSKAYSFAKESNSKRGIPNIEQAFGVIYIEKKDYKKAIYYLEKSIESAKKSNYYDIVLSNYGFMIHCYPNNPEVVDKWFNNGISLINTRKINTSYKTYFFKTCIAALKTQNQPEKIMFAQESLIKINDEISLSNNNSIQNITNQYIKNENKLLKQELNLTKSKKEKQIFYATVIIMGVILIGIWIFFKQRQKFKNQEIETLKQNQEIAKLEALIDGEENERRRIAQELHDGINGELSAIKHRLSAFEEVTAGDDRENLMKTIDMIDNSCAQVRSISHNLMPASIIDFGLVETIRQYCAKIGNAHPLELDFQYFGDPAVLPQSAETVIYRIIQELINNIIKHSDATSAIVQMNFHENELSIIVEDNGKGFDVNLVQDGIGLRNIKSRVDFLNAELEISSNDSGSSFHVTINLNLL